MNARVHSIYKEKPDDTGFSNTFLVELDPLLPMEQAIESYQATGLYEYVEPDYVGFAANDQTLSPMPDDTYFPRQWSHHNDGSFTLSPAKPGADIRLTEAWELSQGDEQIIVAILDSGVKPDHPEFAGRLWVNENEIPGNNVDDDGNGFTDDVNGWNFVDHQPDIADRLGHGTHVTGIIGANGNNKIGYAGVDWRCRLMICKVLKDDYSGLYSWWSQAIHYAVDHGANVINMSIGGTSYSHALKEAVEYAYSKNVLVVASMQNNNSNTIYYPAGYARALAVGSTDPDDRRTRAFSGVASYGSNYGNHIDVVAPGNYIYGLSAQSDTAYDIIKSGTSQSAPLVSGLASLLWAKNSGTSVHEIENIIFAACDDEVGDPDEDVPGWDPFHGFGRINAWKALSGVAGQLNDQIDIFPNPASQELNIDYRFRDATSASISIVNNAGQVVRTIREKEVIRSGRHTVTVEGLDKGFYYILITAGNNVISRKIVIR
jgi:thermitase